MSENDIATLYLKSFFNSLKLILENLMPEEIKSQIVHQNMSSQYKQQEIYLNEELKMLSEMVKNQRDAVLSLDVIRAAIAKLYDSVPERKPFSDEKLPD